MAGATNPARERNWGQLVGALNQQAKDSGRGRPCNGYGDIRRTPENGWRTKCSGSKEAESQHGNLSTSFTTRSPLRGARADFLWRGAASPEENRHEELGATLL